MGRSVGERQRPRLGGDFHVARLHRGNSGLEIDRAESDVINRMAGARRRVAFLHDQPDAAHVDPLEPAFHLRGASAELLRQPRQHRRGVWRPQVNVMQPELLRILHDLDARAPRIFDERKLEQPGRLANGLRNLQAFGLKRLHRAIYIRHREADVIEHAAFARQIRLTLLKDDARVAVEQAIARLGHHLSAEMGAIPRDRLFGIGRGEMDVIDDRTEPLRGRGDGYCEQRY